MNRKEELLTQVIELLNEADTTLPRDEYKDFCDSVQSEAYSRYDAMESEDFEQRSRDEEGS